MAIKLSKDFKRLEAANTGFNILFTSGGTYDLDEIIASHDRANPDGELIIQVKDGRTIAERILSDLLDNVKNEIKTTLSDDSMVKQDINDIIKLVFKRYNYEFNSVSDTLYYDVITSENVPLAAYKEVIYQVNQYLRNKLKTYDLTYKIKFAGSGNVEITYAFDGDDSLNIAFAKFYRDYADKYRREIEASENEGSLSIDNTPGKVVVRNEDYAKYLLSEEESSQPYKPAITGRRAVVIWEEGTSDENEDAGTSTVYDEIDSLKEIIYHLQDLVRANGGTGTGQILNIATTIDKYTTNRDLIPTVGAVIEYVDSMIKDDNYEIEGTRISGNFGNVNKINVNHDYYRLYLEEDNLVLR